MLVQRWMKKTVITVDINDSMQKAVNLMKDHNIRRLPVLKKSKLVGIVTDRDLKKASASDATSLEIHEFLYLLSKITIKDIMTKTPITVPFDFTVEETAEILLENKISGVPVVDHQGQLTGIITQTDIFRALISLTGIGDKGIQFAYLLEDRSGSIKEVTDIIRKYGGRIVSILSSYKGVLKGYRKVYIRMYGVERDKLLNIKNELKGKVNRLYFIDHRENKRQIFKNEYNDFMKDNIRQDKIEKD